MTRNIDQEVEDFVKSISDMWKKEPLDGDETQEIANRVLAELEVKMKKECEFCGELEECEVIDYGAGGIDIICKKC